MDLFLRGLLLGFSIAAPVGPIGLLCIRRTLADGRLSGFAAGLGAASADALYGLVAAFGLTAIQGLLVSWQQALRLGGGVFLLYLGWQALRTAPAAPAAASSAPRPGLAGAYLTTLALTLTNPMTILSFAAVFAGAGLVQNTGTAAPALLVLGVFTGSAAWWLTLSILVGLLRERFLTRAAAVWINRASGALIMLFALVVLLQG